MAERFETERLTVRTVEENDWASIREIWTDFNSSPYVFYDNEKNTDPEDVKRRIARWAEATRAGDDHLFFVSCLDGIVIGFVSLNRRPEGYELGYGFLNRAQGQGYAAETLRRVLPYMKKRGAEKITAGTALANTPSVRLLTALGFSLTGTERISLRSDSDGNPVYFDGGLFEKIL